MDHIENHKKFHIKQVPVLTIIHRFVWIIGESTCGSDPNRHMFIIVIFGFQIGRNWMLSVMKHFLTDVAVIYAKAKMVPNHPLLYFFIFLP